MGDWDLEYRSSVPRQPRICGNAAFGRVSSREGDVGDNDAPLATRLVPPVGRLRLICVFAAGVAICAAILTGWGSVVTYAVPLLAVAVLAAELAVVHLSFGKQRWSFSVTEAAI